MTRDSQPGEQIAVERELRFGVVMYGGVSLAIYMNGVSQELFQLSLATAQSPEDSKRFLQQGPTGTAATYRLLARLLSLPIANLRDWDRALENGIPLSELSAPDGPVTTKFVIDTISGSSAGGINGAFLGKALACNLDLDGLQRLWIKQGNILKLINDRHSIDADSPGLKSTRTPRSLLNGQRMVQQLLLALDEMDRAQTSKPGVERHSGHVKELDVFLTATDVRGMPVGLRLADGLVSEYEHRSVFGFRYRNYNDEPGTDPLTPHNDFLSRNNALLAFAARCTSSFPFAFEPVTLAALKEMKHALPPAHQDALAHAEKNWQRWLPRAPLNLAGQVQQPASRDQEELDARTRPFCDGGYLDNKPFSYAVDALVSRVAEHPVERRLLYVEPHPEREAVRDHSGTPDAVENVVLALTLAGYEAFREDLERVLQRNVLVERADRLLAGLDSDLGLASGTSSSKTGERFLTGGLKTMIEAFGAGYGGYHRLKVGALTDEISLWVTNAAGIDSRSGLFAAVRLLVRVWREKLFAREPDNNVSSENQLLYRFDLSFRIRRLRFVLRRAASLRTLWVQAGDDVHSAHDALTAMGKNMRLKIPADGFPGCESHGEAVRMLDDLRDGLRLQLVSLLRARRRLLLKGADNPLHESIATVVKVDSLPLWLEKLLVPRTEDRRRDHARQMLADHPELLEALKAVGEAAAEFVFGEAQKAREACEGLFAKGRAEESEWGTWLVAAVNRLYDEYHHYDFLSFPVTYATDAGQELAAVDVIRISPQDAVSLVNHVEGDKRHKLAGDQLMNFGGFFQEEWRRNDILWGRLDTAERLIHNLVPEGLNSLAKALTAQAHEQILAQHYRAEDLAKVTQFLTEQLDKRSEPKDEQSDVQHLIGRLLPAHARDTSRMNEALLAATRQALQPSQLRMHFSDPAGGYEVDRKPEPLIWAEAISRMTQVAGRVLDDVGARRAGKEGQRLGALLTRVGAAMWGMVIVATPNSLRALFFNHLFSVFLFTGVVILLGSVLFSIPEAQNLGWIVIAVTLAVKAVHWVLSDLFHHRVPALRMLGRVALAGLVAVGGLQVWTLLHVAWQSLEKWIGGFLQ
jgi:patatin-related protein